MKVRNTGNFDGKEIVQLYVREAAPRVIRPEKELKGFEKIHLKTGEEKTVEFRLDRRAFAYWDETERRWRVDSGKFSILIGASSADIRISEEIEVAADNPPKKLTIYSSFRDLRLHPNGARAAAEILRLMKKEESEIASDSEQDALLSLDWCILRNIVTMFDLKLPLARLKKCSSRSIKVMAEAIEAMDFAVLDAIQRVMRCAAADAAMAAVSWIGGGILWAAVGIFLLFFKKYRFCGIASLGALLTAFLLTECAVKLLVLRERPYLANPEILLAVSEPSGTSFPSAHTATSFAAAVPLFRGKTLWGIAGCVLPRLWAFRGFTYMCIFRATY